MGPFHLHINEGRSHGEKMSVSQKMVIHPTVEDLCSLSQYFLRYLAARCAAVVCGFASSLTALFAVRKKSLYC